jgi:hypothetical protein
MDMDETDRQMTNRLEHEVRSEMIARLEQEIAELARLDGVWAKPGPVSLERALGELGFDWNELENIAQKHVHLGIPFGEYPKTDVVYARAWELQNAVERREEEAVRDRLYHHLHSWVVEAEIEEGIWEENAMWLNVRHVPDPVSYYLHDKEWREFAADVERAMASPGERFVGGRIKHIDEDCE